MPEAGAFAGRDVVALLCLGTGLALGLAYLVQRRSVPAGVYSPRLAWLRAGIWFSVCGLIASYSGALAAVLQQPLASTAQVTSPAWWAMSLLCLAVIIIGYGIVWPRGTFTDGRTRHVPSVVAYGLLWGASQGLLFLSIWLLVQLTGLGTLWSGLLAYLLIGGFQACWHRYFWDIHVSPPHNYREWNARKVLFAHTPNLIACLAHLALFGNAAIFVLLQTLALLLSAWAMRFPAWRDEYTAEAGQERYGAGHPLVST